MFKTFRDYLWVLQAFLRGKVLRQKAYQPQGNFFRLPVPMTTNRILMLMKWWGLRHESQGRLSARSQVRGRAASAARLTNPASHRFGRTVLHAPLY